MIKVTALEKDALRVMLESSEGNGHDFGFVEDLTAHTGNAFIAGALITNLMKKELIRVWEPVETDTGVWTQFTWRQPVEVIEELSK